MRINIWAVLLCISVSLSASPLLGQEKIIASLSPSDPTSESTSPTSKRISPQKVSNPEESRRNRILYKIYLDLYDYVPSTPTLNKTTTMLDSLTPEDPYSGEVRVYEGPFKFAVKEIRHKFKKVLKDDINRTFNEDFNASPFWVDSVYRNLYRNDLGIPDKWPEYYKEYKEENPKKKISIIGEETEVLNIGGLSLNNEGKLSLSKNKFKFLFAGNEEDIITEQRNSPDTALDSSPDRIYDYLFDGSFKYTPELTTDEAWLEDALRGTLKLSLEIKKENETILEIEIEIEAEYDNVVAFVEIKIAKF